MLSSWQTIHNLMNLAWHKQLRLEQEQKKLAEIICQITTDIDSLDQQVNKKRVTLQKFRNTSYSKRLIHTVSYSDIDQVSLKIELQKKQINAIFVQKEEKQQQLQTAKEEQIRIKQAIRVMIVKTTKYEELIKELKDKNYVR